MLGQPSQHGADRNAVQRQADGFLGEEYQGGPTALGRTDGHEQGDGDAFGVLEPGGEADRCLVGHRVVPFDQVVRHCASLSWVWWWPAWGPVEL